MRSQVSGVLVGSRKAGTTWLYENMKADALVSTTEHVKESRFFLGKISEEDHAKLFKKDSSNPRVEIDTSLYTDDQVPARLRSHNEDIRTGLILREPSEFAVSRFIHGRRKGEYVGLSLEDVFEGSHDFRAELDYKAIVERFSPSELRLRIWRFEELASDPVRFYSGVRQHLAGIEPDAKLPQLTGPINQARNARKSSLPALLSTAATRARAIGLHRTVNAAKALGFHRRSEQSADADEVAALRERARLCIEQYLPSTYEKWSALDAN